MTRGISDDANAAPSWLRLGDAGAAPAAPLARALDLAIAVVLAAGGLGLLAGAAARTDAPPSPLVAAQEPLEGFSRPESPKGQVDAPPPEPHAPTEAVTQSPTESPTDDVPAKPSTPAPADAEAKPRDPKAAETAAERGQHALRSGKRSSAKKLFDEALALDPDNAEAMIGLSNLSFDAGNYATAEKYARQAVQVAPRNADYHLRLGDAYFKLGQLPRARGAYQKAAKLGHPFAAARLDRLKGK